MSKKETADKKKKSRKRELTEWGVIIFIAGALYLSGYHTEVIGKLQSLLLYTGLLEPDTEEAASPNVANYQMPLISAEGEALSLGDFQGKTIFMNFWATWCPPCIAEMPNIQKLYESTANDSLVFVMISLDEDPQTAKDFIIRKEYTLPIYFLNGYRPAVYNSTVVPTTYVISPTGDILLEHQGMANYNTDKFKKFLQKAGQLNGRESPEY